MIRLWGNSKRYMKLETEKTYIAHIKSLKRERWVERDREKERKRERGNMEVVLLE